MTTKVAAVLIVSFLSGWILKKTILLQFENLVKKTRWRWDDTIVMSIGKMPMLWTLLTGIYYLIHTEVHDLNQKALLTDVVVTILILSFTIVLARLIGGFIVLASSDERGRLPSSTLLVNVSRFLIYLVGIIVVLQNLKIEITPIITALGIGGLAVALALEETLNNLFSGVQIIATRMVRQGDYVKLDSGYEGYVTDIKARSTTILSFPDNNRIIVPNSIVASSVLVNYNLPERSMWVELGCGVAYSSDLETVEKVTLEVAKGVIEEVEGSVQDSPPVFRYTSFGDSSIDFLIRVYIKEFKVQFELKHILIKRIHQRFEKEGIDIPFPIRTVYMKNTQ